MKIICLIFSSFGLVWSGLGLVTGGFDSSSGIGGVDLSIFGWIVFLICGLVVYKTIPLKSR